MINYIISVNDDEKEFGPFESFYQFSKKENIGDTIFVTNKQGKISSLEILDIDHLIEKEHTVRLLCRYNKLFS